MSDTRKAWVIATMAHDGQFDKAGDPYIGHPVRVQQAAINEGLDDYHEQVALLHDVLEDTWLTTDDLYDLGFSRYVVEAVDAISRRRKESVEDYYARVKANEMARTIKLLDIADNLNPLRLSRLDEATQQRLTQKYAKARALLAVQP